MHSVRRGSRRHRGQALYNVLFPVWLLVWLPSWLWLLLIPANYLIDRIVLWWGLKGVDGRGDLCRRHTWKVCLAGFAADFVGSALLLACFLACDPIGADWAPDFSYALCFNPFGHPVALLVTLGAIALSGVLIYVLDGVVLRKAGIEKDVAKRAALRLSLITAPYLFLLPSALLYR